MTTERRRPDRHYISLEAEATRIPKPQTDLVGIKPRQRELASPDSSQN